MSPSAEAAGRAAVKLSPLSAGKPARCPRAILGRSVPASPAGPGAAQAWINLQDTQGLGLFLEASSSCNREHDGSALPEQKLLWWQLQSAEGPTSPWLSHSY